LAKAGLCIAGEPEWRIGWPYTAQKRVAALIGFWNKSSTREE
jgi:hypothetical protein